MTIPRRPTASDIASACGLENRSISLASKTTSFTRHIGLHMLHADGQARPRRLTGGDAASRQRALLFHRRGLGSRLLCIRSASTAWRARGRASWAPIHSALEALPYGGRIAVAHEHWDGHSRPRNVDYPTRRLGDHEPYPSYGFGGPGDVSRARGGRLEVTLRSLSPQGDNGRERVLRFPHMP